MEKRAVGMEKSYESIVDKTIKRSRVVENDQHISESMLFVKEIAKSLLSLAHQTQL